MRLSRTKTAGAVFVLTDYGTSDELAGVVRAVVSRESGGAPVVDITHDVAPFDVRGGALALARSVPCLGRGVVLAVVDPGVGGERRAIAVETEGAPRFLVGPDNGLLGFAIAGLGGPRRAVSLPRVSTAASVRSSFDGRDVFAPAAARLWSGTPLLALGTPIDPATLVALSPPHRLVGTGEIEAEVLWVDRFGNVQLSVVPEDMAASGMGAEVDVRRRGAAVEVKGSVAAAEVRGSAAAAEVRGSAERARAARSFESIAPGEVGVVLDANGHVALACNRSSAATVLGVKAGDVVVLTAVR